MQGWGSEGRPGEDLRMKLDDMILVSVDDHVVEPADMWAGHLSEPWVSQAPRLVHKPD